MFSRSIYLTLCVAVLFASRAQAGLIDLQLVINPIQICGVSTCANPSRETYEQHVDKVWAQAGIDIHFLDFSSYISPADQRISGEEISRIDYVRAGPGIFDPIVDIREKASWFDTAPGATSDTHIVDMWFVDEILGLGPTVPGVADLILDPECEIAFLSRTGFCGADGVEWGNNIAISQNTFGLNMPLVLAHEIGHVLGLFHPDQPLPYTRDLLTFIPGSGFSPPGNLMHSMGSGFAELADIAPDGRMLGQLLDQETYGSFGVGSQIATARSSPYLIPFEQMQFEVPTPSSAFLLALGLLLTFPSRTSSKLG